MATVLVVMAALPLALGALSVGSFPITAPALVTGVTALVFPPDLCQERPPARHSPTRSTARTPTGLRGVDLTRVASVRLWTTFSPGGVQQRVLLVRDVHGVRLGITSAAGRRALRTALARQQGRRARVGRAARACAGDGPGRWLARHAVTMFLSQVLAVCGYMIGFLEVSGPG